MSEGLRPYRCLLLYWFELQLTGSYPRSRVVQCWNRSQTSVNWYLQEMWASTRRIGHAYVRLQRTVAGDDDDNTSVTVSILLHISASRLSYPLIPLFSLKYLHFDGENLPAVRTSEEDALNHKWRPQWHPAYAPHQRPVPARPRPARAHPHPHRDRRSTPTCCVRT